MKALIDGDIVAWKGLTVCEGFYNQIRAIDWLMDKILDKLEPSSYELVFSGSNKYRKAIYPSYKSARDPAKRPRYLMEAKNYLIKYRGGFVFDGEADDYLGMNHNKGTIIASTDKDMLQLGGSIYLFDKRDTLLQIEDSMLYFWIQVLVGDKTDSIPGLKNPAKAHHKNPPNFTWDVAEKLLKDKSNEQRREIVEGLYKEVHKENWYSVFDTTASLCWILRDPGKTYHHYV